jgi:hypothetical protein
MESVLPKFQASLALNRRDILPLEVTAAMHRNGDGPWLRWVAEMPVRPLRPCLAPSIRFQSPDYVTRLHAH